MTTNCVTRSPDLTVVDTAKNTVLLIDIACQCESNKGAKSEEKNSKYQ